MPHRLARDNCRPQAGQHFEVGGKMFELRGKLGDGAAGLVRKASPLGMETLFAVKFLAPDPKYIDPSAFEDVARRFKREGERGVHLTHDHLLKILAYCENEKGSAFATRDPKNPFLLMEYLGGKTLESYIRSTQQSEQGVFLLNKSRLSIAIQLADSLKFLRDRRLVHRDIKPANIFLEKTSRPARWLAKLGDFGVMKWGDFHSSFTTGTLTVTAQKGLGTLKYMSPEQAVRPDEVTSKADVWSLGITLFELFTGQILASAHHVYELQNARRLRGNSLSRFGAMSYRLPPENEGVADLVLDMFLAPDGRPAIDKICGRLQWEYSHRFSTEWGDDV